MSGYATDKEKGPGFDKGLGGSSHAIAADNTNEDLSAFMKEPGEVEVFATGPGNVDFRTVGWMKGNFLPSIKRMEKKGDPSIPSRRLLPQNDLRRGSLVDPFFALHPGIGCRYRQHRRLGSYQHMYVKTFPLST